MKLVVIARILLPLLLLLPAEGSSEKPTTLRGLEGFTPCSYEPDPTSLVLNTLTCSEEASAEFSSYLPIIRSDNVGITSIRISGTSQIKHCPQDAFSSVNAQNTWQSSADYSGVVQALTIKETNLIHIQRGCFRGLEGLQELRIRNTPGGEVVPNSFVFGNTLFTELKGLVKLQLLHLENVDLSSGIPEHAFDGWSRNLRSIRLVRNRLTHIHDDAFIDVRSNVTTTINTMIMELRIEKQTYGWKLLRNSQMWARRLHSLQVVSFEGSIMQTSGSGSMLTVDFGEEVNRKVKTLNLNGCGLTNVVEQDRDQSEQGIRLAPLAGHLHRLFLDHNRLDPGAMDFLHGLRNMSKLWLLSLENNRESMPMLPDWMGRSSELPSLRELRLSRSGLTYLRTSRLPTSLKTLHLSANPLRQIDPGWATDGNGFPVDLTDLHMNYIRLASVNIGGHQADWVSAFRPIAHSLQLLSLTGCQLEPYMLESRKHRMSKNVTASDSHRSESKAVTNSLRVETNYVRVGLDQLGQLKTLILSNNYLTEIPNGAFSEMKQLRNLALARNGLRTVETPANFTHNWDSNSELVVKSNSVKGKPRLKRLDLRGNQLTTLNRCKPALGFNGALEEILPLRPAWLAGERHSKLMESMYGDIPDSPFHDDSKVVQNTDWLGGLSLTDNPLQCDCRLAWLRIYVEQMDIRIDTDQMSKGMPRGYQSYKREALDFICSSNGMWSGRRFLSLKAIDLYAADHQECRDHPKVYGSALTTDSKLTACSDIAAASKKDPNIAVMSVQNGPPMKDDHAERFHSHGLSTLAMVMVCVAGVATFFFLILCLMVIFWFYFNTKRTGKSIVVRRMPSTYQSGRGFNYRDCCTCMLCYSCRHHTNFPGNEMLNDNIRKISESTDVYTLYEEPNAQGNQYAEMSEGVEDLPVNKNRGRSAKRGWKAYHKRPSQVITTNNSVLHPSSMCSSSSREESTYNPPGETPQVRQPLLSWYDRRLQPLHESATRVGAYQSGENVGTGAVIHAPILRAPLPPVPAPRKTKSTVDLLTTYVEDIAAKQRRMGVVVQTSIAPTLPGVPVVSRRNLDPERRRHNSDGLPSHWIMLENPRDNRLNNSDVANIRRAVSDPANMNEHPSAGLQYPGEEDVSGAQIPTPLPVSRHVNRKRMWLRKSRQIVKQGIDRLTCATLSPRRRTRSRRDSIQQVNNVLEGVDLEQQRAIEENKRYIQGPKLPRPMFYTQTDGLTMKSSRENKSTGDYLSMEPESHPDYEEKEGQQQQQQRRRPHTDYVRDEYVTGLSQPVDNELVVRYRRLPSLQRKSLQLDSNLYTLTLNGDAKSELTRPTPQAEYHNVPVTAPSTPTVNVETVSSAEPPPKPNRPLPIRTTYTCMTNLVKADGDITTAGPGSKDKITGMSPPTITPKPKHLKALAVVTDASGNRIINP